MKFNVDDLVEEGLIRKKTYASGEYAGLSIFKYDRKVFFNNLWDTDARLLECRGRVVDEEDNVIVNPFRKVFNLHENGTEVDPETEVIAPRKVNGFLGCVTNTEDYGVIYSTTGSLDSDYAEMIKKYIPESLASKFTEGYTLMFEICDPSDPHIVHENTGAYLIGVRSCFGFDELNTEYDLDAIGEYYNIARPEMWRGKFKDLPDTQQEGYVIRAAYPENTQPVLAKLKSKHYLNKKALMRVGKNKANAMFNDPLAFKRKLDEEFYDLFDSIIDTFTKEDYYNLTEQDRRSWIEDRLKETK